MPGAVRTCKFAVKAAVPAPSGRTQACAAEPGEAVKTVDHPTAGAGPDGPEPRLGGVRVLGRYRLQHRLGAGGFGVVWMARDEHLGRAVAVKRIPMHDAASATRAEREGLAAARLGHPGIVALFEAGRDAGAVYLVSELVRGSSLADLIAQGALSDRDVLLIGIALCDALAHAHSRGVVHRDVKPGNVLVPESAHDLAGVAKLTDFGVARMTGDEALTRTGDVVGTLAYMAPEQAAGRTAGAPADLYGLGLVLYEALSGVNPIRAAGAAATARRVGMRLPRLRRARRDLPEALCDAIDRTVLPRPGTRGDLGALRVALAAALPAVADEPLRLQTGRPAGLVAAHPRAGLLPGERHPATSGVTPALEAAAPLPAPGGTPLALRAAAGASAGLLAALALAELGPEPLGPPAVAGAVVALGVAALPRLGWLAAAVAIVTWLVAEGAAGPAVIVPVAAVPVAVLLRRTGHLWSAPAGAPVLGAVSLAGAWPALAGQAGRLWHRVALGVLGAWWLVMAEALTGERLAAGPAPGTAAPATWWDSAADALRDAVAPALSGGALLLAVLWGAAAAALPLVVRGRAFALDLVGATAWAAGVASATQAVAEATGGGGTAGVRGLVAGAVAAGAVAVGARASRGAA
jgi:hypothetical protein